MKLNQNIKSLVFILLIALVSALVFYFSYNAIIEYVFTSSISKKGDTALNIIMAVLWASSLIYLAVAAASVISGLIAWLAMRALKLKAGGKICITASLVQTIIWSLLISGGVINNYSTGLVVVIISILSYEFCAFAILSLAKPIKT